MLAQIKTLLGLTGTEMDTLLNQIISLTEARLKVLLGGPDSVPEALSYITVEVCVRRYNRIGSEGLASHTVEGETMTWPDDDFAPYASDIQAWIDAHPDEAETGKGIIRFI